MIHEKSKKQCLFDFLTCALIKKHSFCIQDKNFASNCLGNRVLCSGLVLY